jgi:hypothetical protein
MTNNNIIKILEKIKQVPNGRILIHINNYNPQKIEITTVENIKEE